MSKIIRETRTYFAAETHYWLSLTWNLTLKIQHPRIKSSVVVGIVLRYLSSVLPPFPFHSILLYIFLFFSNPLLPFLLLSSSIFSLSITQLSITQPSITQPFYYSAFYYSAFLLFSLLLFSFSIIQLYYSATILLV